MFESIEENCILIEDKYIDTCPSQRENVRAINKVLLDIWMEQEQTVLGKSEMIRKVDEQKAILKEVDRTLFKRKQRTPQKTFILQYMIYVMDLYMEELDKTGKLEGKAEMLFTKTYFDQEQEGVNISEIALQNPLKRVRQYDPKISVAFTVRNFEKEPITDIEDIYCFASIGKDDFIFPLDIPTNLLDSNTIQTINTSIITEDNPILDTTGEKTIYCTMVYQKDGQEMYTPYEEFTFDIEQA